MSFFDDMWNNPFGGMFDFNHDGKEDFCEQWDGYRMLERARKSSKNNNSYYYNPETNDHKTEELVTTVPQNNAPANIGIKLTLECPALDKLKAIKESDYKNKRRYNAAYNLANDFRFYTDKEHEEQEKSCCRFILENADTILAANYCTHDQGFLYAQAVKDNFTLPISLPDETETPEYSTVEIIGKLAKRDVDLALQVWTWLVEKFLPYAHYTRNGAEQLSVNIIGGLYWLPENFKPALAHYLNDNPEFCDKVLFAHKDIASHLSKLVCICLTEELFDLATKLFKTGLEQADSDWKSINNLTSSAIDACKTYSELETMEKFQAHMFPLIKAIDVGMVRDEIEDWEKEIAEYIETVEDVCEKYAYSRKNAWRAEAPDGSQYGLDPCDYNSMEEYLAELNERKYSWRKWYKDKDTLGLSVDDFETRDEFREVFNARMSDQRQKECEQREQERRQKEFERFNSQEAIEDKNIYTLCGISFPHASHPYHYKTDDSTIKIGDTVIVPVGDKETEGTVISVGQYTRQAAPFPIDKIKTIISRAQENDN